MVAGMSDPETGLTAAEFEALEVECASCGVTYTGYGHECSLAGDRLDLAAEMLATCADAFGAEATRFTCTEAESIAKAMTAFGLDGAAFLGYHAEGDREGDQHHEKRGE